MNRRPLSDAEREERYPRLGTVMRAVANRTRPRYIPMGFSSLDDLEFGIGGLGPGMVTIVGARPGVGKTSAARAVAVQTALDHRTLITSLEYDNERFTELIAAQQMRMPILKWRAENCPVPEGMLRWADEAKLRLFDADNTLDSLIAAAHDLKPQVMLIDHLREIDGWLSSDSRSDVSPTLIMQKLTRLAKQTGTHIMAFSQLTRDAQNRRPNLSDLRDSGGVEEKADSVILLHRPYMLHPDNEPDDVMEMIVAKAREGPLMTHHLAWWGPWAEIAERQSAIREDISLENDWGDDHFRRCHPPVAA